jgi:hypothetical protein
MQQGPEAKKAAIESEKRTIEANGMTNGDNQLFAKEEDGEDKREEVTAATYMEGVRKKFRAQLGDDGQYWYEMLGECYIHGMMDGEAMAHQNDKGLPWTVFEIR